MLRKLFTFIGLLATASFAQNLVPNPGLETPQSGNSALPASWNQGGYGTNTAIFTYPVAGQTGFGAKVELTSWVDGDVKYYFKPIPVSPGETYAISVSYQSSVASRLSVQFTESDGKTSTYVDIAKPPATSAWTTTLSQTVVVPPNAVWLTVFPLLEKNLGWITIDNMSVTRASVPDLFPTGLVSLSFDDGPLSQFQNALPPLQAAKLPATFYIISDRINSLETIFPSADNPLSASTTKTTASSVTWSEIYTDPTLQYGYNLSYTYTAAAASSLVVTYTPKGGVKTTVTVGTLPPGTNAKAVVNFTLPVLGVSKPISIQPIAKSGTLTASNPVLGQWLGYMNTSQVLSLQDAGHEIGNHTVHHPLLELLEADPNSATIPRYQSGAAFPDTGELPAASTPMEQIDNATPALLGMGVKSVTTFAYPYGSGAGDMNIENIVKSDGLIAARSVTSGYNFKSTDPYNLKSQSVKADIDFKTAKGWIDYAAANNVWLILTFHQVENDASLLTSEDQGTTTAIMKQIVNYVQQLAAAGKIKVRTVHDVMTQYMQ